MFYVTLPSNSSMGVFPNNTVTHFTTQLPQAIRLTGEWECGLVSVQYPHTWFNIHPGEVYIDVIELQYRSQEPMHRLELPAGYYPSPKALAEAMDKLLKHTHLSTLHDIKDALTFRFDEERQVFQIKFHKKVQFGLSPRLQRLMGMEFDYLVTIPSHEPYEGVPNRADELDTGLQALYLYCDVIESRVVGDTLAPLLRAVSIDHRNNGVQVSREFQHIQYLPVQKKEFTTVEIDIRDDYGRSVPFSRGKVIVTLHFRRKRSAHFT